MELPKSGFQFMSVRGSALRRMQFEKGVGSWRGADQLQSQGSRSCQHFVTHRLGNAGKRERDEARGSVLREMQAKRLHLGFSNRLGLETATVPLLPIYPVSLAD